MPRAAVSAVIGRCLEAVFATVQRVRPRHPLHPSGVLLRGTLTRHARSARSGLAWIDEPWSEPIAVLARASRSAGLPAPLPDVLGLALRFETEHGPADIELASTGFGVPSRFWLALHRSPSRGRLNTLFPYKGGDGPVLLCARTIAPTDLPVAVGDLGDRLELEPWRLRLYFARPLGKWHPFAELELSREDEELDPLLRFDAVRHPLPGTEQYDWVRNVRQPTYERVQGPDIG
jgi:hypothetical protein